MKNQLGDWNPCLSQDLRGSVLLCIFVTLTQALKKPSMPLKIVLLLCVQKGRRPSSATQELGS